MRAKAGYLVIDAADPAATSTSSPARREDVRTRPRPALEQASSQNIDDPL